MPNKDIIDYAKLVTQGIKFGASSKYTCLVKWRDSHDTIVCYDLVKSDYDDKTPAVSKTLLNDVKTYNYYVSERYSFTIRLMASQLKEAMLNNKIKVTNLKLTSDYRIVDDTKVSEYIESIHANNENGYVETPRVVGTTEDCYIKTVNDKYYYFGDKCKLPSKKNAYYSILKITTTRKGILTWEKFGDVLDNYVNMDFWVDSSIECKDEAALFKAIIEGFNELLNIHMLPLVDIKGLVVDRDDIIPIVCGNQLLTICTSWFKFSKDIELEHKDSTTSPVKGIIGHGKINSQPGANKQDIIDFSTALILCETISNKTGTDYQTISRSISTIMSEQAEKHRLKYIHSIEDCIDTYKIINSRGLNIITVASTSGKPRTKLTNTDFTVIGNTIAGDILDLGSKQGLFKLEQLINEAVKAYRFKIF
jgi:hypothetical protein